MSLNGAYSTVATAPSPASSGTSLTVAAGTGSRFFAGKAVVWPANTVATAANLEVVTITNVSTDTLTITRLAEGAAARSIVVGDQIAQGVTAGMWDGLGATYAPKASALALAFKAVTGAGTDSAGDYVRVDATSGAVARTLPASPAAGAMVTYEKTDATTNAVTVSPSGGGTIGPDPSASIVTASTWTFVHVGSNAWRVFAGTGSTGPALDTNAADITSTIAGSASAGATGKAADAGHQHPVGTHTHANGTNGGQIGVSGINATGTPSALTYLRGDGSWQTPAGGAGGVSFPVFGPIAGDWFTSQFGSGNQTAGGSTVFLNELVFMPVLVPYSMTITAMAITINTAAATGVVRLGIYTADSTTNRPSTLVIDAGTVDASTTGVKTVTISQTLTAGLYWCGAVAQTAMVYWRAFGGQGPMLPTGNSNLVIQTPGSNLWKQTGVTAALPGTASPAFAGNVGTGIPIIGLVRS